MAPPPSPPTAPRSPSGATLSPLPTAPAHRKSFLGKLPIPKKIPRPTLRPFRTRRSTLFAPIDPTAPPLGILVIRVLAARNLVARDRNGTSDPFVVIRCAEHRVTGPTIEKCLNPVWGAGGEVGGIEGAGGESKLEVKLWESRGLGRELIEIVIWDKDKIGKQYLGEVSLGLEQWWGDRSGWVGGVPPVGLYDKDNKPIWHPIRSSRRTSVQISGELLVQVGFIPASASTSPPSTSSTATLVPSKELSPTQRANLLSLLHRYEDEEREGFRRTSKEEMVLLASPTEGVGTLAIEDVSPLGLPSTLPHLSLDDTDAESLSSSSGEESDEEEASTVAETSTDDEDDLSTAIAPPEGYFDQPHVASPSSSPAAVAPPPPVPVIIAGQAQALNAASPLATHSTSTHSSTPSSVSSTRRVLSIPAFMKRSGSSKSVPTLGTLKGSEGGDSDVAASASADNTDPGAVRSKKKRFSRKKKSAAEADSGLLTPEADVGKRKKSQRKKGESILRRRGTKRDYRYEDDDDMFGLVQIEVKRASDLPRFKNMLKTGWDMDPFVVVSFGKKVFRTRVVRHSLNPVWDEKLFFSVRRTEVNWIVAFNVYDWDKLSSNDHVFDTAIPLADLIGGNRLQPDERGLYPATSEGRLIGDDFIDQELKVVVPDQEGATDAAIPTLHIRAKFTPYDALRQQFLRIYLRQYDIDESGTFSHLEIFSMLDSLGSTLSKETITSFFTRFGKTDDQELTSDEVVLCLEEELRKPTSEKRPLDDVPESGALTPGYGGVLGFAGMQQEAPMPEMTDQSQGVKVVEPGTAVVTNVELGTAVKQPEGGLLPGRTPLFDPGEETPPGEAVERVINIKECPLCHKPRMNSKAELDIVTHMGICSSTDPRTINRIVVGEYVTASQAQRKWFTKVISKATKGAYQLGANSANIIVQDRETGVLQEEKMAVYVRLGIRLMYKGMGAGGGMEGARIRRMLESMSIKQGVKYDSPSSVREIAPFIAFHQLNMAEASDPVESFKTFNQFFYRKLKPEARVIADVNDPHTVVSPADCRAMFFPTVDDATKIWIKGRDFSISKLLGEKFKDKAPAYEGASLAIFRLAPQDYHRYHSPVDGVCGPHHKIAGQYYTVNPMAIRSSIDVYGDNVRLVAPIVSPVFGEVMNIWVGAMMVGSICMTMNEGGEIKRGEECGYFAFGGSTIVVLFPPKTVVFDPDLVLNSQNSVETLVRMGSRIGRRAPHT